MFQVLQVTELHHFLQELARHVETYQPFVFSFLSRTGYGRIAGRSASEAMALGKSVLCGSRSRRGRPADAGGEVAGSLTTPQCSGTLRPLSLPALFGFLQPFGRAVGFRPSAY